MIDIDYKRIIKLFKAYEALLKFAYKNDNSIFKFDIEKCVKIIENIENSKIEFPNIESKIIITEGNPYLTLIICLYSILYDKKFILDVQGNLINVNKQICEIFYNMLENRRFITIEENMSISNIIENSKNREITVIDSKVSYNKYKKYGFSPVYIPLFSIDLIYNDTKYEKLVESVFDYCEINMIEISVLEDIKLEDYEFKINKTFESNSILVLQENITEDEVKKILNKKNIYLNINPFENFEIDCIKSEKNTKK